MQWSGRITYWAKLVRPTTQREIDEGLARFPTLSQLGDTLKQINDLVLLQRCTFNDFIKDAAEEQRLKKLFRYSLYIPGERLDPVGTYTRKGERAVSIEQYEKAVEYFTRALEYGPDNEYTYYSLGCTLGLLISERKRVDLVVDAVDACRKAAELAPAWDGPPTEIAIILSNAGRLDAAVDAFERARPLVQRWAHFHLTYANSLAWLTRYGEAAECYREAIRLEPAEVAAHMGLAACLHELGDVKGVQKQATEIRDLGGPQVTDPSHWRHYVWQGPPNPVQRRADYPREVGPDEPCPCASGKKYRRCCGRTAAGATPPQQ